MVEEYKEEQIDLRDYLRVVQKRKWTILTVFAVVVITVLIHVFTATPIYQATTRLIIDKESPNVVSIQDVMTIDASGTDYYQTQYKIIESRGVAREVTRRLRLDESEEFFPKPKDDLISNMKLALGESVVYWKSTIVSLLKTKEESPAKESSTENPEEGIQEDSALVSGFISRISVSPIRNSRLVDIRFQAKDPALSATIVNTLARAYIDQNLEIRLKAIQDAVKWLQNRIEKERKRVERAEQALLRYKVKYSIVTDFSDDSENITAQKLAQINAQVVSAESRRVEAETRYRQAMGLAGTPDMLDAIPEVLNSDLIRRIKTLEVELYKRASELSKKYGQKHPQMKAIESELMAMKKRKTQEVEKVVNSLGTEYKVSLAREKSLIAALAKQKKESLALNQKAIQYGVLRREVEGARQVYELLMNRFKETSVTEDMRTGNIRILDPAERPRGSIKPNKRLNIILAMIVGLITGLGLAFFFEYLDNTIKLPEDIKRYLNVPYLGPVPAMALKKDGNPEKEQSPELITIYAPKSTASEAYRGIRTGILFSSAERQPQVTLISSVGPREGKTITGSNLAITMAQSGSRVVLLDCDMRRPTVHRIFGFSREKGLSNVLVGNGNMKEVVIETQVPNLHVIPCGPVPPNPSELLGSTRMVNLLENLKKTYSRIIIDSPPVTAVTDAVVLAKWVDGIVLVVRAEGLSRDVIKNGLSQFQAVEASVLGVVLNGVEMGRGSYYDYPYYYYYYGEDQKGPKRPRKKASKNQ